jgi:hypothetical protein
LIPKRERSSGRTGRTSHQSLSIGEPRRSARAGLWIPYILCKQEEGGEKGPLLASVDSPRDIANVGLQPTANSLRFPLASRASRSAIATAGRTSRDLGRDGWQDRRCPFYYPCLDRRLDLQGAERLFMQHQLLLEIRFHGLSSLSARGGFDRSSAGGCDPRCSPDQPWPRRLPISRYPARVRAFTPHPGSLGKSHTNPHRRGELLELIAKAGHGWEKSRAVAVQDDPAERGRPPGTAEMA